MPPALIWMISEAQLWQPRFTRGIQSTDHDDTDWLELDRFAEQLAREFPVQAGIVRTG